MRGWLVFVLSAGVALCAAVVLLVPQQKPDTLGAVALLMMILAIGLARSRPVPPLMFFPSRAMIFLLIAVAVAVPVAVVARAFGRLDLLALVFHIEFGMQGAGLSDLRNEILTAVLAGLFYLGALVVLSRMTARKESVLVGGAAVLVGFNPLVLVVALGLVQDQPALNLTTRLAVPQITRPQVLPDVIVIYLEGVDRAFADAARFGTAYDPIRDLEAEGLTLTGVAQVDGTGWSMAGIVASQCGVPLLPNGLRFRNNYSGQVDFLDGQTCLGDVLHAHGYSAAFVVGGEGGFAGLDHFVATHSNGELVDKETMARMYDAPTYAAATAGWIMDDQMVFDAALRTHDDLRATGRPMFLTVETTGPHGDNAFVARRCVPDGQARILRDLPAAARCTTALMEDFIARVRAMDRDRPLAIVVMSDHINHSAHMARDAPRAGRRNTVVLVGLGQTPARIGREASMMDVYPTVLAWLGFAPLDVRAGLGVSLFAPVPTLREEVPPDVLDANLMRDPALARAVWQPEPSGDSGF